MYADLHIHTNYSDGLFSPAEIVERCEELKIKAIAVTDHDSIAAVEETRRSARDIIEVIPAVEMSSNIGEQDIHILAYYVDCQDSNMLSYFEDFRKHRAQRVKKILALLARDGVRIDFDRIKTDVDEQVSLGRPHIAGALLEDGYVSSIGEAFIRYLGYHSVYYVPKKCIHPKEVIKNIKAWRGVSVLAHPGTIDEAMIDELIACGINGIEIWHPDHSHRQQMVYCQLAASHGLLRTGGSDFHGFRGRYGQLGKIGCCEKEVLRLKKFSGL
jgi:predicted metal-dependent phosphoesterase TrpH